jgi:CAAX prenyl protease-like protein
MPLWQAFRILGYVVTVPIAEELAFRGYLLRRVISNDFEQVAPGTFTWPSWIATSVLFGLMHGSHWLLGTIAGLLFAAALYRRGRLSDSIWAHMTTNGLIAVYATAVGNWSLLT